MVLAVFGCSSECPSREVIYIAKDIEPLERRALETELWVSTKGFSFSEHGAEEGIELLDSCVFNPRARVAIHVRADSVDHELHPMLLSAIERLRELGVSFDASVTAAP